MRTWFRFRVAALLFAALAIIATPVVLFAHARLVRSAPAANSRLGVPPTSVSLWFSEKPELRFTSIELVDSTGKVVALGASASIDSMGVTAPISSPLAPGRYAIAWRAAAADGHGTSGRFSFVVERAPAPAAATVAPRDTISVANETAREANTVISTPIRWAELIAAITLIGAVVFRLFVLPRAEWPADAVADAADRTRRLAMSVLVLFIITSAMRLFAESNLVAGAANGRASAMLAMVSDTQWGRGWLFSAVGALMALAGMFVARAAASGWILGGLGAVAVCVGEALTGHAGSLPRYTALAVSTDVAHFLGAGGWVGGLLCLVLCGLPSLRKLDAPFRDVAGARLARAYHRAAAECVIVVIVSALIAAWLRLDSPRDLVATDYGQTLFRKAVLVVIMLGFGAYHWRTAVKRDWTSTTARRFRLSATVELLVGAIIVGLTTLLVSTALPTSP